MTRNETLAYLAGVLDSDGSITAIKLTVRGKFAGFRPQVFVSQTAPEAVHLFSETFGGMPYRRSKAAEEKRAAKMGRTAKPLWYWTRSAAAVEPVLTALLPFLRIKRPQAEIVLRLQELRRTQGRRTGGIPMPDTQVAAQLELARAVRALNDTRFPL